MAAFQCVGAKYGRQMFLYGRNLPFRPVVSLKPKVQGLTDRLVPNFHKYSVPAVEVERHIE